MPATVPHAAYDLALRSLEHQERRLAELRSRSGTLIAAATIAGSFLGSQAVRDGSLHATGYLALLAYLVSVGASLSVLVRHELLLEFSGVRLLAAAEDGEAAVGRALDHATQWLLGVALENRSRLAALSELSAAAVVALGIEILLWSLTLTDTLG